MLKCIHLFYFYFLINFYFLSLIEAAYESLFKNFVFQFYVLSHHASPPICGGCIRRPPPPHLYRTRYTIAPKGILKLQ